MTMRSFSFRLVCLASVVGLGSARCGGEGSSPTSPSPGPSPSQLAASVPWARVSGRIAYTRFDTPTQMSTLAIIDGSTRRVLDIRTERSTEFLELAFRPAGDAVAYTSLPSGRTLRIIRLDGTPSQPLFPADALLGFPAYANDGRLAYVYNNGFPINKGIFIDGVPFLTDLPHELSRVAWSPDGREMVVSRLSSPGRFELVDVATKLRTTIYVADRGIIGSPVFSADGALLAFERTEGGPSEIWVCNRDGSGARRLTAGFGDASPAFSPDGTEVVFARYAGISGSLRIIKTDGSQEAPLIDGFGYSPSWIR